MVPIEYNITHSVSKGAFIIKKVFSQRELQSETLKIFLLVFPYRLVLKAYFRKLIQCDLFECFS